MSIVAFYVLSSTIVLYEIIMCLDQIIEGRGWFPYSEVLSSPVIYDFCYVMMIFTLAVLGLFQFGILAQLGITVSHPE